MVKSIRQPCNALSKGNDLKPCGQKEAFPGSGTCRWHGGMNFNVAHKALRRVTLGRVARLPEVQEGTLVFTDNPFDALNQTLIETREFKELIQRMIDQMAEDKEDWRYTDKSGAEQLDSRIVLYERALDRTIRASVALSKLNIEERFLKLSEQQAASMMWLITEVFKRVGMSDDQMQHARDLVPEVIAEMLTQTGKKRYI